MLRRKIFVCFNPLSQWLFEKIAKKLSLTLSYHASSANSPQWLNAALLFHVMPVSTCGWHDLLRRGAAESFLLSSLPPASLSLLLVAIRRAVISRGWEEKGDLKSRTGGRSFWRYRYFRSVKRVPGVSTISSVNPVGYAGSPGSQRISAMNPRIEERPGNSGRKRISQSGTTCWGESAHLLITFSRNVSCGIFGGFLRRGSIMKRTRRIYRQIFRGCVDVCLVAGYTWVMT